MSGLSHPHSKKVLSDIQSEPPVFQFVPSTSGPVTGHSEKSLSSCSEKICTIFSGIYIQDMIPPDSSSPG